MTHCPEPTARELPVERRVAERPLDAVVVDAQAEQPAGEVHGGEMARDQDDRPACGARGLEMLQALECGHGTQPPVARPPGEAELHEADAEGTEVVAQQAPTGVGRELGETQLDIPRGNVPAAPRQPEAGGTETAAEGALRRPGQQHQQPLQRERRTDHRLAAAGIVAGGVGSDVVHR